MLKDATSHGLRDRVWPPHAHLLGPSPSRRRKRSRSQAILMAELKGS